MRLERTGLLFLEAKETLESVEEQIEKLKAIMHDTESLSECDKIQERITRLASGISVIRVGAATEIEMIEKTHRIEDALEAVKSAQAEGVLPGGGSFLVQNSMKMVEFLNDKLENETQALGVKIVQGAVREPLKQMCLNAGESPDIIVQNVRAQEKNFGYDFSEHKMVNLTERGVIDPARVTRCALQNSVSVAGTLITSNFAIVEV